MEFDYTYWEPFSPAEVAQLFSDFPTSWCIAGGWGLDLFIGNISREHADIDLVVFRKDQHLLFDVLRGFEIFVVDPPGTLRPWSIVEYLSPPLYNIWVRTESQGPWKIQVMLQDQHKQEWLFRRDHSISGAVGDMIIQSENGIPLLHPIIQLLYKAKDIRRKDQHDFQKVLPYLQAEQKIWLREKIGQVYGQEHDWLPQLLVT
ncbi:MAG: hypothetical protein KTR30_24255 [Saprospiraceae bacterium]|nr:hypothetical protein [Saprospiraceae bacterium]